MTQNRRNAVWTAALLFGAVGFALGSWFNDFMAGIYAAVGLLTGMFFAILATGIASTPAARRRQFAIRLVSATVLLCTGTFAGYRHYTKYSAIRSIESLGGRVFNVPMKGWFSVSFQSDTEATVPITELKAELDNLPPFHLSLVGVGHTDDSVLPLADRLCAIQNLRSILFKDTRLSDGAIQRLKDLLLPCQIRVTVANAAS